MNMDYHKGYPCVYKAILCQEGYCSDCVIYLDGSQGGMNEETSVKNPRKTKRLKSVAYSRELAVVK